MSYTHITDSYNAKRDDPLKFDYNNKKVRGVNLGGWFVLEPWITPSIFEPWAQSQTVKDEYTFCQTVGATEAYNQLSNHWNTWITQDDFNAIAAAGLNHVRIPIGYWSIIPNEGDPYVQGAYDVLGKALDWAQSAGLMVIIDLHGGKAERTLHRKASKANPIQLRAHKMASTTAAASVPLIGLKVTRSRKLSTS